MLLTPEILAELMPVAHRIARRYYHTPLGKKDAEGAALLGLVEAARRFDPDRHASFRAYAIKTMAWRALDEFISWSSDLSWHGKPTGVTVISMDPARMEGTPFDDPIHKQRHTPRRAPGVLISKDPNPGRCAYLDLREQLDRFRPNLRTVVILTMLGFRGVEIAEHLNVHESRVSQLLGEARQTLLGAEVVPA